MTATEIHSNDHEVAPVSMDGSLQSQISMPVLVLPNFELATQGFNAITKAVITISKGYHVGDLLELDTNYTLFHDGMQIHIENTNVTLPDGGFNPITKQLVLAGEDSLETYESIFESILLANQHGVNRSHHEVKFTVFDDDGIRHRLGTTNIDFHILDPNHKTVLDELVQNDSLMRFLDEKHAMHDNYKMTGYYLDQELHQQNDPSLTVPEESTYLFGKGYSDDLYTVSLSEHWPRTIQLTGITEGPSAGISEEGSWMLTLEDVIDYRIQDNTLMFADRATGTVRLSDGTNLNFQDVDMILWSSS